MTAAATPSPPRRRLASLTGLLLALILPAILSAGAPGELPPGANMVPTILLNEAIVWALALTILGIILFWERRSLLSIGLGRPSWAALGSGAVAATGLVFLALTAAGLLQAAGLGAEDADQAKMVMALPIALQIVVVVSAGFTEEILFRGYAVTRTTELTGSRWLGALIPVFAFGAVHAPFWGVGHALVAGLTGLWLTLIFLWRRNLWINIAAHALLDGSVFLVTDIVGPVSASG